MPRIVVDSEELEQATAKVEMYADILEYVDENDIDDVEGYAEELKEAADTLWNIVFNAETVEGVKK